MSNNLMRGPSGPCFYQTKSRGSLFEVGGQVELPSVKPDDPLTSDSPVRLSHSGARFGGRLRLFTQGDGDNSQAGAFGLPFFLFFSLTLIFLWANV
jgi:hypothetical protein